jgi:hypothetical protein
VGTRSGAPNTPPNGPPPSNTQSEPNLVRFDPKQAVPQQPIYLQRNDYLAFNLLANNNLITVRITYRWLTPEGEIKEGELDSAPFANTQFLSVPLYEGWLLSFSARMSSGNPAGTWCFCQALLVRTAAPSFATFAHAVIWQGYITTGANNGWPGTPAKEITDGPGVIRSITGTLQGPGADIAETVPNNRRWILLGLRASLTTSAVVANRNVSLRLIDPGVIFYNGPSYFNQAASTTQAYSTFNGTPVAGQVGGDILLAAPLPFPLKANFTIKTQTLNLQGGDQWTAPEYVVLEWGMWDA